MSLNEKLKKYRLSESEYQLICDQLGREPQGVEWALYSALWSEHCSYKSSKVHLKKLFNKSEKVLQSFGENAGVIDLGQGERVAFKMESHNHPSFIEPYQGAATGVGGILRDIFTMGARPVALANYLCFGESKADRMETLVKGVVSGISGYGNCVGVPNITGQTEFHSSYNNNILVNAFALGLYRPGEKVFTAKASGPGNLVVYVGAKTGRDGVHGASMASESFDDNNDAKKPNVQIGDPFFEKLLIESCIEVMRDDLVVAIQDMGAAGLTSSSFEMASSGGVGFNIALDKVPLRDGQMMPEEILLSESQERMLLICEPKNLAKIEAVFAKWNLDATAIGEVTENKMIKLTWHNEVLCEIDPDHLVENAPLYNRPYNEWTSPNKVDALQMNECNDLQDSLLKQLSSEQGCARNWIYDQYDQRVGAQTISDCSGSVGMVRLPDSERALGVVLGCRPHVMRIDSQVGGYDSIAYPSLELAAKGFETIAVTDCLNFGNPEKPELMSEFVASVQAMSEQCEKLNAPIISGNVSLYNETNDNNITSTPATGLVGVRDTLTGPANAFQGEGDVVLLAQLKQASLSGMHSELNGGKEQFCGAVDAGEVAQFNQFIRELVTSNNVTSSRVVGKFGLAYALAKMTSVGVGCEVTTEKATGSNLTEKYFAEHLYQVVLTLPEKDWESLQSNSFPFELNAIGKTTAGQFKVDDQINLTAEQVSNAYSSWTTHFEKLS